MNRKVLFSIKLVFVISLLAFVISILSIDIYITYKADKYISQDANSVMPCYTAIVLGASVSNEGELSSVLTDRMQTAMELYQSGKVQRFLLSGDHGRKQYDEVNSMKNFLLANGISSKDIFLDHAGFDTYNSLVRAKKIFEVNRAIIVTQDFHLPRAVFIGRSIGLDTYGAKADKREYRNMYKLQFRELLANVKAVYEVLLDINPKYLGSKIPITGDSQLSWD